MSSLHADLQNDLIIAVDFFQNNPHATAMPFMHSFPKNCCERCAALLTMALAKKYSSSNVLYVEGRNEGSGEMHYWIEVDNFVVDPTAHQFDGFSEPFVRARPSPFECTFTKKELYRNPEASTDLPKNSRGQWEPALAALYTAIGA